MKREDLKEYILSQIKKKYPKDEIEISLKKKGVTLFIKSLKYDKKLVVDTASEILEYKYSNYQSIYHIIYDIYEEPKCQVCGQKVKFRNMIIGYNKYCSCECSTSSPEVKKKFVESFKKTCRRKYGVDNVFQLDSVKNKSKQTNLRKYGKEYSSQREEVKEKNKQTNLRKYGKESPLQCEEIKERIKNTNLEKRGVEYPTQSSEVKEKIKQSNLKKWGYISPNQNSIVKEKTRQTNLKKYGKENVSQVSFVKEKITEGLKKSFLHRLLNSDRLKGLVTPNFSLSDYSNVTNKHEWTCNKCGNVFYDHLDNGKIPRCYICFPRKLAITSHYEDEIYRFLLLNNIQNIVRNYRSLLSKNKELDFYLPDYHLAIEFNGLYSHSELNGKDKHYHLSKTSECQQKGITLLHIFEDEWVEKQEIVKSILLHKLNLTPNKIYARNCQIKFLSNDESFKFLDENHLQGFINSKYHLGLFYNEELVSILSISSPRFNKNYSWEILRFCNKNYHLVIGGFSKLLKYFKSIESGPIITYSDIRLGLDSFYNKVGFKLLNRSDPNYFYTKSGFERESRLKYQKHKLSNELEIFDPTLTEWENMQLNNYDRIWDCGNLVFEWK